MEKYHTSALHNQSGQMRVHQIVFDWTVNKGTVYEKLFFYFFFFNSVLRPFQDYFSSYETGQSVGGGENGRTPRKTT